MADSLISGSEFSINKPQFTSKTSVCKTQTNMFHIVFIALISTAFAAPTPGFLGAPAVAHYSVPGVAEVHGVAAVPTSVVHNGVNNRENFRSQDAFGNYASGYSVADSLTGDFKSAAEQGIGDAKVGFYSHLGPDGVERRTDYVADAFGTRQVTSTGGVHAVAPAPAVASYAAPAVAAAPVAAYAAPVAAYAAPAVAAAPVAHAAASSYEAPVEVGLGFAGYAAPAVAAVPAVATYAAPAVAAAPVAHAAAASYEAPAVVAAAPAISYAAPALGVGYAAGLGYGHAVGLGYGHGAPAVATGYGYAAPAVVGGYGYAAPASYAHTVIAGHGYGLGAGHAYGLGAGHGYGLGYGAIHHKIH